MKTIQKQKIITALVLAACGFASCTKFTGGAVVPESLEYFFEVSKEINYYYFDQQGINNAEFEQNIYSDNEAKVDYIVNIENAPEKDIPPNNIRAVCIYDDYFSSNTSQDNFSVIKFPGLKNAQYLISIAGYKDNQNDIRIYKLDYANKVEFHFVERDLVTLWRENHVFEKPPLRRLSLEVLWKSPKTNEWLGVIRNSGRISGNLEIDTLIFYNFSQNIIVNKYPFAPFVFNTYTLNDLSNELIVFTHSPNNNYQYQGLSDSRFYAINFNEEGNIVWLDTLGKSEECKVQLRFQCNDAVIYSFLKNSITKPFILYSLNPKNGKISDSLQLDDILVDSKNYIDKDKDSTLLVIGKDYFYIIDKNLKIKRKIENKYSINTIPSYTINEYDINNDGANDILVVLNSSQIALLDGNDFRILAATPVMKDITLRIVCSFLRNGSNPARLFLSNTHIQRIYNITDTPFLMRLEPHITLILFLSLIFLFIPLIIWSVKKIRYLIIISYGFGMKSNANGIIIIQSSGNIIKINNKAKELLGIAKTKGVLFFDLPPTFQGFFQEVITENKNTNQKAIRIGKDKSSIYYNLTIFKIFSFSKQQHWLVQITDATEAYTKEVEKQTSILQLENALILVHNIKNPLTVISGMFKYLTKIITAKNDTDIEKISNYFDTINSKLIEAFDGIDKALYYANQKKIEMKNTSLKDVIGEWINRNRHKFNDYSIEVLLDIDKKLPEIKLDAKYFWTLLDNVVNNSIDEFIYRQDTKLIVFRAFENDINQILLEIEDNAGGIKPEIYKRIMNNEQVSSKPKGTGFGMKIMRDVCSAHGAEFDIQTIESVGTKIIVKFMI